MQNWYDNNYYPPIDTLEAICHALGITLADFFYEEDHPGTNDEVITIEDKLLLSQ